ncbi:unnamed protein product [Gadus morhua 'NCC']
MLSSLKKLFSLMITLLICGTVFTTLISYVYNARHQKRPKVTSAQSVQQHQTELIKRAEEKRDPFLDKELKKLWTDLFLHNPQCSESEREEEEEDGKKEEQRRRAIEGVVDITKLCLVEMNQEELADTLWGRSDVVECQHKIESNLKKKFRVVFEGIAKAGQRTDSNVILTEIFIKERGSGEVNKEHERNPIWTDVTKSTSVDVLLTNLIRGALFPSARIWITTRPAAANQIPAECVDMVTEVRGFTDQQKEEYFRKRFREETLTSSIISHVKNSRSLHIMCHIPVFCLITATVLEDLFKREEVMPKTVTQMYSHFLRVQSIQMDRTYHGRAATDSHWSSVRRKIIVSLGKLAFNQLEKGHLIFYEADLAECGIDIRAASVYSGVFTQIFKEECGLYQDKVFCFVHLSLQEFLAALYVFLYFNDIGVNLLSEEHRTSGEDELLYQSAVDKALQSENGHLDLFLRFLLGLSLKSNQKLLRGLLVERKKWSALVLILLSSEEELKFFDLKKYSASEEGLLRLLPLVKASKTSLLNGCHLSDRCCEALASVLSSSSSSLRELDLSSNDPLDSGVKLLSAGLGSPHCTLETLRLNGCHLSERCCEALASVLSSSSSSLIELDMSNNDLQDSGVKLLSAGLGSPHCTLETLSLSGCLVTQEGCISLISALSSNPSHLRALDLSYNHPGDSGAALLSALLKDPHWRLDTLSVEHGGVLRLKPVPQRYACDLTLDPNTAYRDLSLSEDNRKVTRVRGGRSYPYHPDRFDYWDQVLGREALTGRCYWEVEWKGGVYIGVTYRGITRRGGGGDSRLGRNNKSWCLDWFDDLYSVWYNGTETYLPLRPAGSTRVGVYLDRPAGSLSFYSVSPGGGGSSDTLTHLHTFQASFTQEDLLRGVGLWREGTSVSLCRL